MRAHHGLARFVRKFHLAVAQLSWSSKSQAKQIIPTSQLFSQPSVRVNHCYYQEILDCSPGATASESNVRGKLFYGLPYQLQKKPGDVLVIPATGAYGHSMANNYNAIPRPPVIFCRDGQSRVVVRRETYEDLAARDQL